MLKGGRAAHAWAKDNSNEFETDEDGSGDPLEEVEVVADYWGDIWQAKQRLSYPRWMSDLRHRALQQQQDREPITDGQLKAAIASSPRKAGKGLDCWMVSEWQRLDNDGRLTLLHLLQGIEQKLKWPAQVLCNTMVMAAKPQGGHRLLALTAALYRCWSGIRRPRISEWESDHSKAAFWDTAIRGSQALRTALLREFQGELATLLAAPCAELLWDIRKFYDSIVPQFLAALSIPLQYPAVELYLGMACHLSSRTIRKASCFSGWVVPGCSILAGCTQSTTWSKIYLSTFSKTSMPVAGRSR